MKLVLIGLAVAASSTAHAQFCAAGSYSTGSAVQVGHTCSVPPGSASGPSTTLFAHSYSGADASVKINACLAAVKAAGGGTCDASDLGGTANQAMSAQINVGDSSQTVAETLILPSIFTWTWSLTGGTGYAIYQYNNSVIRGDSTGGGGNQANIMLAASANMKACYGTDNTHGNTGYFQAGNFSCKNYSGATVPYLFDIEDAVDESYFHDMTAVNDSGNAILIENSCCGVSMVRVQGYASNGSYGVNNYTGGGIPLTLGTTGGSLTALAIRDSTFNAPGVGKPNISIGAASYGITFDNVYEEGNCQGDTTTAMNVIASGASVEFRGGAAWAYCNTAKSTTKYTFENHGVFSVANMVQGTFGSASAYAGAWINNVSAGTTYPGIATSLPTYNVPYNSFAP